MAETEILAVDDPGAALEIRHSPEVAGQPGCE